jgi:putative phage-type endonuclease
MLEIKQGTDAWHQARLGKVTASKVADVMAKTKSGPSASRTNYMMELLCQRLTGAREEGYQNAAMQRGTNLEPIARIAYEAAEGVLVDQVGFVIHPSIPEFGASPDGLVGKDGLIEIKCPNTAQHVDFLRTGRPDGKYIWQMQAQIACAERDWCDFVSYDDRLPEALQYKRVRIMRDSAKIAEMETEIRAFLAELDALVIELRGMANAP